MYRISWILKISTFWKIKEVCLTLHNFICHRTDLAHEDIPQIAWKFSIQFTTDEPEVIIVFDALQKNDGEVEQPAKLKLNLRV